jgi:hypothetical protein
VLSVTWSLAQAEREGVPILGQGRPAINGIWRSLYFGHRDTLDLSTSAPGQPAYAIEGVSVFARAFRNSFEQLKKGDIDKNKDAFINWRTEFLLTIEQVIQQRPERTGIAVREHTACDQIERAAQLDARALRARLEAAESIVRGAPE